MRYFIALSSVVTLLLLSAACGSSAEHQGVAALDSLRVEDFHYAKLPGGARVVSGKVHNPSSQPIKNAQVQISLFDENNRFVESMSVLVQNVPPGDSKPFRRAVDGDERIRRARVRSILVL